MLKLKLLILVVFILSCIFVHLKRNAYVQKNEKLFNSRVVMCVIERGHDEYKINEFLDHHLYLNISKVHIYSKNEQANEVKNKILDNYNNLGYDIDFDIIVEYNVEMLKWECLSRYIFDDMYDYIIFNEVDEFIIPSNIYKHEITMLLEENKCVEMPVVDFKLRDATGTKQIKAMNSLRIKDGEDIYENFNGHKRNVRQFFYKKDANKNDILLSISKNMITTGKFYMDTCDKQAVRRTMIGRINATVNVDENELEKDIRLLNFQKQYL